MRSSLKDPLSMGMESFALIDVEGDDAIDGDDATPDLPDDGEDVDIEEGLVQADMLYEQALHEYRVAQTVAREGVSVAGYRMLMATECLSTSSHIALESFAYLEEREITGMALEGLLDKFTDTAKAWAKKALSILAYIPKKITQATEGIWNKISGLFAKTKDETWDADAAGERKAHGPSAANVVKTIAIIAAAAAAITFVANPSLLASLGTKLPGEALTRWSAAAADGIMKMKSSICSVFIKGAGKDLKATIEVAKVADETGTVASAGWTASTFNTVKTTLSSAMGKLWDVIKKAGGYLMKAMGIFGTVTQVATMGKMAAGAASSVMNSGSNAARKGDEKEEEGHATEALDEPSSAFGNLKILSTIGKLITSIFTGGIWPALKMIWKALSGLGACFKPKAA
jgi:hypothetical protein